MGQNGLRITDTKTQESIVRRGQVFFGGRVQSYAAYFGANGSSKVLFVEISGQKYPAQDVPEFRKELSDLLGNNGSNGKLRDKTFAEGLMPEKKKPGFGGDFEVVMDSFE